MKKYVVELRYNAVVKLAVESESRAEAAERAAEEVSELMVLEQLYLDDTAVQEIE